MITGLYDGIDIDLLDYIYKASKINFYKFIDK